MAEKLRITQVRSTIKRLENQGFTFEGAEGSVELLLRRALPGYQRLAPTQGAFDFFGDDRIGPERHATPAEAAPQKRPSRGPCR